MKYVVVFLLAFIGTVFGQVSNTIYAVTDTLTFDTDGALINANYAPATGFYYVQHNDYLVECPGSTHTSVMLGSNATLTMVTPDNSGTFDINLSSGEIVLTGTTAPGDYIMQYKLTDVVTGFFSVTEVLIRVIDPTQKTYSTTPVAPVRTNQKNTLNCDDIICFPDPNLKTKLLTFGCCETFDLTHIVDRNGDGEISRTEALEVYRINAQAAGITDLTGLQYFTRLTFLNISSNTNLTTINTSVLPNTIEYLWMRNTAVTTLNTSNFPNLWALIAHDNQITSLDFSSNHLLTQLITKNNSSLTSINIKNGINQDVTSHNALYDCWANCPLLTNVCVDASEMAAVQDYLTNCGHDMSVVNVNSTCALGVESVVTNNGFTITPNPSSGVFTVAFDKPLENAAIEVFNLIGQSVMRFLVPRNDKNVVIDLTNYPSGVYLMVIKTEQGIVKERIIKN